MRSDRTYTAIFLVYRRHSERSNEYTVVPGSVRVMGLTQTQNGQSFTCLEESIPPELQFQILENDILGACIKDTRNIDPLLIVGSSDGQNSNTYQVNIDQRCRSNAYSGVSMINSNFVQQETLTLHLQADIGMSI